MLQSETNEIIFELKYLTADHSKEMLDFSYLNPTFDS